jgi:hypothetical protein
MDTNTQTRKFTIGDKVTPDPDAHGIPKATVGRIFIVRKVNPKNILCDAEDGGRGISYPAEVLLPATDENLAKATTARPFVPREFFVCGEVVTFARSAPKGFDLDSPFVVLKDNGEKVNVAPLGGDEDRYWRVPHAGLTKRNIVWLTESLLDRA